MVRWGVGRAHPRRETQLPLSRARIPADSLFSQRFPAPRSTRRLGRRPCARMKGLFGKRLLSAVLSDLTDVGGTGSTLDDSCAEVR